MEKIYALVTESSTWASLDSHRTLFNYFITEGAFTTCFLIALGAALLGIVIFYAWIGMNSVRLSNFTTWLSTLLGSCAVTFCATQFMIVGSAAKFSGYFGSLNKYAEGLRNSTPQSGLQILNEDLDKIRTAMDGFCDTVSMLHVTNLVLVILLFFIISVLVKGFTPQAKAVPF